MSDRLYETDSLSWSEQQADLLGRLWRGERVNAAIDWANVIEEIQDVGRSELHSVQGLLRQAMLHLLEIRGWPHGPTTHWQSETLGFLADAQQRFGESMRDRVGLDALYRKALRQTELMRIDGEPPTELPRGCPFTLDDLLADEPDLARLAGSS